MDMLLYMLLTAPPAFAGEVFPRFMLRAIPAALRCFSLYGIVYHLLAPAGFFVMPLAPRDHAIELPEALWTNMRVDFHGSLGLLLPNLRTPRVQRVGVLVRLFDSLKLREGVVAHAHFLQHSLLGADVHGHH